jgi:large subunit ribosomal protein L28
MSKVCQLTGAKPKSGHKVSHSNRKSKRRFLPNLIQKKVLDEKSGTWVKVKMTARAGRTLVKNPKKFRLQIALLAKKALKKNTK